MNTRFGSNMKCTFKHALGLLFMATVFAGTTPSFGRNSPLKGIFYQPWREDLALTPSDWDQRMSRLHQDGLDTLYIQWLRYGDTDFLNARLKTGEPIIAAILDSAATHGINIYMGLFSDPDYFHALPLPLPDLTGYLSSLRTKSLDTARSFVARYGKHPAFHGWYLPEEIDDLNWQSPDRQQLLNTHLRRLRNGLKRLDRHKSAAVSSFFTGAASPEAYAAFCKRLMDGADHLLLVQDGLGTGRTDLCTTQKYHDMLHETAGHDRRLYWVVELFNDELPGPGFSGKAVPPDQFHERLAVVHELFRGKRLIAFSLRYWLDENARLSEHYGRHFHQSNQNAGPEILKKANPPKNP